MQSSQDSRLGSETIPRLLLRMSLPAVAAQCVNVLYNVVDRIYIGNIPGIGAAALTGVGVTFPILMIISAFSAFVGMGGAPLASIKMGQGDNEGAEKILGNSVTLLVAISAILTGIFLAVRRPMLFAFGASDAIFGYANDYITIYLLGTVFVQLSLGLNTFISAQGFSTTAMLSVVIGAVVNIVLDPIFIFLFDMGVRGAALATILSQAVSATWVMRFLLSKKSILQIRRKNLFPSARIALSIATLGVSPFIMQSTESLVNIVFNTSFQRYGGDLYVGSITIMTSIMQMIVMPIVGIAQGAQPIISYNYGAKQFDRVKKTFRLLFTVTVSVSTFCCLIGVLFPRVLARMFTQETALLELTGRMMPVFLGGIFAFGAQMACQNTFLALGQAKISIFLALLRKIILLIPLALILPVFFGVEGIYFSEPAADIGAATVTVVLFFCSIRKVLSEKKTDTPASQL